MRAERSDQIFVDAAGQHHQRCIARLRIRDAQAGNKYALLAQRLQRAGQRDTTACTTAT